jgi:hypothetical protein
LRKQLLVDARLLGLLDLGERIVVGVVGSSGTGALDDPLIIGIVGLLIAGTRAPLILLDIPVPLGDLFLANALEPGVLSPTASRPFPQAQA